MGQLFFSHTKLIGRGSRAPHQKLLFNLSNQSVRKLIMLIRSDYREFLIYFTTRRKIIATKTRDNVECSLNRRLSCSCPQSINYFRESVHFITGIYDSMSLKDLIYCIFFVKHKSDEFWQKLCYDTCELVAWLFKLQHSFILNYKPLNFVEFDGNANF